MKQATLRQLKTFETVARRLSFSRAAEELYLTQPAVSIQVKQLEEHFGVELFAHVGRRILLTPAGREMLGYARAIIDNFRAAEEAMVRAQGAVRDVLRIGVELAGSYVFPRVIAAYSDRGNRLEVDLVVHDREELLARLAEGEFDLGVVTGVPVGKGIESKAFAPHSLVLVAAASHPYANQLQIDHETLAGEPLIAHHRASPMREMMEVAMPWHRERFKPSMEIADTESIKQFVAAGMGIALLSAHSVEFEVQLGVLKVLDVVQFPYVAQWHVVHRIDRNLPPAAQEFRRFLIKDAVRTMPRPTTEAGIALLAELA
ncbi:MAG TPA: LysR family transcriptional regulator [Pararobbsia sp.]|nr:LysR family transcriptional regulator [Pararobbsia sp.]